MKVYITVPTNRESGVQPDLVQWLLTLPANIPDVEFRCDILRGKPVVSNRNISVKRFLESDCDVFFSIDDDMVPSTQDDPKHGGLRLLLEDIAQPEVDVLTAVALKAAHPAPLPVVMKMEGPYKQRVYHEILRKTLGLHRMENGASGAASLVAKRHVLQKFWDDNVLWFKDEFYEDNTVENECDEWGTRKLGQDAWFWTHATKFGFGCYVDTRVHWGHVKMCDLRSAFNKEQSSRATELRMSRLPLCFAEGMRRLWGNVDFAASAEFLCESLMYAGDVPPDQMIVELGCGVSTLALSMILTPDRYVVYEHDKEWREHAIGKAEYLGEVIRHCPLHEVNGYEWYKPKLDPSMPVGLLIVDGPPVDVKGGRSGGMPEMYPFLADRYRVLLDDIGGEKTQAMMKEWQERYGMTVNIRHAGDGRQFAIMEGRK